MYRHQEVTHTHSPYCPKMIMDLKDTGLFVTLILYLVASGIPVSGQFYDTPGDTVVSVGQTVLLQWSFPPSGNGNLSVTLEASDKSDNNVISCTKGSKTFKQLYGLECLSKSGEVNLTIRPALVDQAGMYMLTITNGINKQDKFYITVLDLKLKVYDEADELVYTFPPDQDSITKKINNKGKVLELSARSTAIGKELRYDLDIQNDIDIRKITCYTLVNLQSERHPHTSCSKSLKYTFYALQSAVPQHVHFECGVFTDRGKLYIRQGIHVNPIDLYPDKLTTLQDKDAIRPTKDPNVYACRTIAYDIVITILCVCLVISIVFIVLIKKHDIQTFMRQICNIREQVEHTTVSTQAGIADGTPTIIDETNNPHDQPDATYTTLQHGDPDTAQTEPFLPHVTTADTNRDTQQTMPELRINQRQNEMTGDAGEVPYPEHVKPGVSQHPYRHCSVKRPPVMQNPMDAQDEETQQDKLPQVPEEPQHNNFEPEQAEEYYDYQH